MYLQGNYSELSEQIRLLQFDSPGCEERIVNIQTLVDLSSSISTAERQDLKRKLCLAKHALSLHKIQGEGDSADLPRDPNQAT